MKKELAQYLAEPGKNISLKDYQTRYNGDQEKEEGILELEAIKKQISKYQEIMYAANSHALLIVFQAMDAAGKDSAIEHVMSGINPQGCEVYNFKTPTAKEYSYDFLWRHYQALPPKGKIGVHNRSHYENVLVCKVHPEYILNEEIPGISDIKDIDKGFWKSRYESIRNFETHLAKNGTVIIKFFLHVSKDEQKQRFLDRLNDPEKHWKFSEGDLAERKLWDDYMDAYEAAISATSSEASPWYIIPADKKWHARLTISQIINDTLSKLNLEFPELNKQETSQLKSLKEKLMEED